MVGGGGGGHLPLERREEAAALGLELVLALHLVSTEGEGEGEGEGAGDGVGEGRIRVRRHVPCSLLVCCASHLEVGVGGDVRVVGLVHGELGLELHLDREALRLDLNGQTQRNGDFWRRVVEEPSPPALVRGASPLLPST